MDTFIRKLIEDAAVYHRYALPLPDIGLCLSCQAELHARWTTQQSKAYVTMVMGFRVHPYAAPPEYCYSCNPPKLS